MTADPRELVKRPLRRSGVVVPQRLKWHGEVAAWSIAFVGKLLASTLRLTIEDEPALMGRSGPLIAALWHNRLGVAMPIWQVWQRKDPQARLAALISASRDGALLAKTFSRFRVQPVRGSSSRRGAQALLELTSALRQNVNVAITPDGPRGPKYQVQPGIISLAQVTGVPIIPIGVHILAKKELRSWDGFQVPLPFSKVLVKIGAPIHVPRNASAEELETQRSNLRNVLISINPD